MQITQTRGTQHIEVNTDRLRQFLNAEQFHPEIIDELHLVLLPASSQAAIADDLFEDYEDEPWVIFVPCGNKDAAAINQELFTSIRRDVLEEAFAPWINDADEHSWQAWGQPQDIQQDAQAFAARAPLVVRDARLLSKA